MTALPVARPTAGAGGALDGEALGLLEDARARMAEQAAAIAFLLFFVRVLVRAAPPCDPSAERRILGALLAGRADLSDVAGLALSDFTTEPRRALFAIALSALELGLVPTRARVRQIFELTRWPGVDLVHVEGELGALPYPARTPRGAIELVRALGRRWRST